MQIAKPFSLDNKIRMTPLSFEGEERHNEARSSFRRSIAAHLCLPQHDCQRWLCNQYPSREPGKICVLVRLEAGVESVQQSA